MSSGSEVDLDWAGVEAVPPGGATGVAGTDRSVGAGRLSADSTALMSDEEILGIETVGATTGRLRDAIPNETKNSTSLDGFGERGERRDSSDKNRPRNDAATGMDQSGVRENTAQAEMPGWMAALAANSPDGAEARALWQEHQTLRAVAREVDSLRVVAQEASALREQTAGLREI